jgi:hypothetical protein
MEPPIAEKNIKAEKTYSIISDKNHSFSTVIRN